MKPLPAPEISTSAVLIKSTGVSSRMDCAVRLMHIQYSMEVNQLRIKLLVEPTQNQALSKHSVFDVTVNKWFTSVFEVDSRVPLGSSKLTLIILWCRPIPDYRFL